jgi:hypothetical protein
MIKPKPNVIVPFNDKLRVKNLVLEVINDSWIYQHTPDSISLNGELFTLTFLDKKFVFEDIKVDNLSDYVDVFLQGLKRTADQYSVIDNGSNIVITFNQSIAFRPDLITASDFFVKGKIVNR